MDQFYMKRALELALGGIGHTNPNPIVGAVIVKDGKIIGEGYHAKYGGPHAEINAFNSATESVHGATMYVTLEPCSHFGKTPPCADAIIEKGIKKVVIGMMDPNPQVAGQGIKRLNDHGIEVVTGILEAECLLQNEIFIKYITTKKPFCLLKYAMTLDGKIASVSGDSRWINNETSRHYVHQLRNQYVAIMVGIGTVMKDNPHLNTRLVDKVGRDPIKIVVDTHARTPLSSNILINTLHTMNTKTIIATTSLAPLEKIEMLITLGAEILMLPIKDNHVDLEALMIALGEMAIDSVLIEGGGELNFSAVTQGLVDKVNVFVAPKIIGGKLATSPVGGAGIPVMDNALQLNNIKYETFDDDLMITGYL